ncbi:KHG/KDPG aldolase [Salmonella bongori]|nr:KHG/KDPG aldolase [Salmonella bongori]
MLCIGGSWLVPADALEAGDYDRITTLAREAVEGREAVKKSPISLIGQNHRADGGASAAIQFFSL